MPTRESVIEALKTVIDPELHLDIYTMGLVYDIVVESDEHVQLTITYTTPMCPYGPLLEKKIDEAMHDLGFKQVEIKVVFDPPWQPSAELRAMLGFA